MGFHKPLHSGHPQGLHNQDQHLLLDINKVNHSMEFLHHLRSTLAIPPSATIELQVSLLPQVTFPRPREAQHPHGLSKDRDNLSNNDQHNNTVLPRHNLLQLQDLQPQVNHHSSMDHH